MTEKQQRVLDFITSYQEKHGHHPSLHQIRKELRAKSINTVTQYVNALVEKGVLFKVKINKRQHMYHLSRFQ